MTPARAAGLLDSAALVTGGNRGIGRAVATALVGQGASVALTGTRRETAERVAGELTRTGPGRAFGTGCDVRDDSDVEALAVFVEDRLGRLDLLVNNAGIGIYRPVPELTLAEFREVVETNLIGAFAVIRACLPLLQEAGGAVVTIGSLAGRHPFRGGAAYNASKFGLLGMTEALMLDLRDRGVRVSTVMPGSVATGFAGRSPGDGANWKLSPEDVAEVVLAVASLRTQALASRIELRPSRPPTKNPPPRTR